MDYKFVLLVFPTLVLAKIEVFLAGRIDEKWSPDLRVYSHGTDTDFISDTERNTFNMSDNNLKNAVYAVHGRRPDNAYLRSPTPWGNLYKKFGWYQVARILTPQNGKILDYSTEPVVLIKQFYENKSEKQTSFSVGLFRGFQNTVSSSWSKNGELTVGQKISYNFKLDLPKPNIPYHLTYNSYWGENPKQSQILRVYTSTIDFVLDPDHSVVVQLNATRNNIKFQNEYSARLAGHIAMNYDNMYKNQHFWMLDMEESMKAAGMNNQKVSREVVDFTFFTNFKVVVYDYRTGRIIMNVDL